MADEIIDPKLPVTKVEPKVKQNLGKIIEDSMTSVAKDVGDAIENEEKNETTKEVETTKEESKEEVKAESKKDDLSEEQLTYAKSLFKALSNPDPAIQRNALKMIVNAAGMDLAELKTKEVVQEKVPTIVELLKEGLGEFDFLADKLGPILEKVLNQEVSKQTRDLRDSIKAREDKDVQQQVVTDINEVFDQYSNSVELATDVKALMNDVRPGKGITAKAHLDNVLKLAAFNKGIKLLPKGTTATNVNESKVKKNREDVGSRLGSERGVEVKQGVRTSQKMNLNDSVNAALETLASKDN